jgi:N-acetylmuramoyl-L-alanine amidase
MKPICIQPGHINISKNSIKSLRTSTGAPNEAAFNLDIANKVAAELRARGFEVVQTDANANDDKNITSKDWSLFLAIHYDADIYGKGGGFVAVPNPATDGAAVESSRIAQILATEYFTTTKIKDYSQWQTKNLPYRKNAKTDHYYLWQYLSAKTPCVLIECGVGMRTPDDHQILHFSRPIVVEGIVRGICRAFGKPYEAQKPPETPISPISEVDALKKALASSNEVISKVRSILYGYGLDWTKISKLKGVVLP